MNSTKEKKTPRDSDTTANDEATCKLAEEVYNGELIQWTEHWVNRQEITPQQAAKLAHCIDPISWPDDQCEQGQIPDALRIKIQRRAESLAERNQTWTLAALVEALGNDAAPYGMRQAVNILAPASQKVGADDTAADGTAADDTTLPWAGEATSALPATAKEIAAAFPVPWVDKWPERLRKAAGGKSYQWLAETVVRRGSRKPGDANTYNPAAVAVALVVHKYLTRAACDAAIRRCFPAWLDEWNDKVEYLKL